MRRGTLPFEIDRHEEKSLPLSLVVWVWPLRDHSFSIDSTRTEKRSMRMFDRGKKNNAYFCCSEDLFLFDFVLFLFFDFVQIFEESDLTFHIARLLIIRIVLNRWKSFEGEGDERFFPLTFMDKSIRWWAISLICSIKNFSLSCAACEIKANAASSVGIMAGIRFSFSTREESAFRVKSHSEMTYLAPVDVAEVSLLESIDHLERVDACPPELKNSDRRSNPLQFYRGERRRFDARRILRSDELDRHLRLLMWRDRI